jgi:hypothetical protein
MGASPLVRAFLLGGLTAGILDGIWAITISAFRGVTPDRVFKYVASGALGRAAFDGGAGTVAAGVGFHFLIAFIAASVFCGLAGVWPILMRRFVVFGLLYGLFVHVVMTSVIVPASAAPPFSYSVQRWLIALIPHLFFIGLPIAAWARREMLGKLDVESADRP